MNGPQPSTNMQDVRVVVTPSPTVPPNVIPMGNRNQNTMQPFQKQMPFQHQQPQQFQQQQQQQQQKQQIQEVTPKLTAQQILHQQMLNKKKALEIKEQQKRPTNKPESSSRERQDDQSAEPSSEDFWLSLRANSKMQVQNDDMEMNSNHQVM
jgi:hypothetical protein